MALQCRVRVLGFWGLSGRPVSAGLVSQAVSVFGFAFYIQPVIMPLLDEMQLGVKLTSYSTRVAVLGATTSSAPKP
jgi:hypothetical protein